MSFAETSNLLKAMEEELIELVRQHEVLYNTALKNYKDVRIRQEAWEEVAKQLNTTASAVKLQWEKLRRCFTNARSRRIKKSGQAAKNIPAWKFENQMQFLLPYLEDRKTLTNLVNLSSRSNETEEDTDADRSFLMDATDHILVDDDVAQAEATAENISLQKDTSTLHQNVSALQNIKQSKKYSRQKKTSIDKLVSVLEKNASLRQQKYEDKRSTRKQHSCLDEIDETDLYFLSLSKITKKLPKAEQVFVKKEVGSIVFDADLRSTQHQQCNSSVADDNETEVVCHPEIPPADEPPFIVEEYYESENASDMVFVDAAVYHQ